MAVKIIKREYVDLYRPTETTDWLLGNVGDWQTLKLTCEVAVEIIGTNSETVSINTEEKRIILNSGKDWSSFGFNLSDEVTLRYKETLGALSQTPTVTEKTVQFTINLLLGDTIEYTGGVGFESLDFALIPIDRGDEKISNVRIFTEKEFEGSRVIYSHITNEDIQSQNLSSFIDGTKAEMSFVGLNNLALDSFQNMEFIGLQSGMSIRTSQIKKIVNPDSTTSLQGQFNLSGASFRLETFFDELVSNITFKVEKAARTIPLVLSTAISKHQTVTSIASVPVDSQNGGIFTTGIQAQMFLFDVGASFTQQYNFNVSFIVSATNETSPTDEVSLVLYRYKNGATLDFDKRIVLQSYKNASSLIDKISTFAQEKTIFGDSGESFSLGIEYFHEHTISNQGIKFIDITAVVGTIGISTLTDTVSFFKRFYEIEIQYQIASFFDLVENVENRIPPDFLIDDGSLTDNFDIRFFPVWNNPNTIVKNILTQTEKQGNTGWFDENFNQEENEFKLESIKYRDTDGNLVQALDFVKPTIVEITISGVDNLNTDSRFGFGFMWLPENEDNFKTLSTPHYRNTFMSNGSFDVSYPLATNPDSTIFFGAGVNGGSMDVKDIHFRRQDLNLVFSALFTPNASFTSQFEAFGEDDRKYLLWLSIADSSAAQRNFSNRVSLLVDVDDLTKTIAPTVPYEMTTKFVEYPFVQDQIGADVYSGVTQDDVLARSKFSIVKADNIVFQQLTFAIEMENIATGEIFQLETFPVELSESLINPDGFQEFNINETRGFKLPSGDKNNFVKINVDEFASTEDSRAYVAFYAFKIRYEDWIEKADVPADFFDVNEDNNGNSNNWFDYINTPDSNFRIKYSIYISALQDGEVVLFRNPHDFDFKDYDQNTNLVRAVRYLRDSDSTLLNIGTDPDTGKPLGVILTNELTRIEMDFTIQDDTLWILANTYAVTTIEIDKGEGIFEMRLISSVKIPESDNPLKPLTGETKLKLVVDGPQKKLTTSCLVDSTLLKDAVRYRITGRVGCFDDADLIDDGGIYETAYEASYE